MEDLSTGSESDYSNSWISWFLSTKGNEYFAEVDEDYILDRFNLTGLNSDVVQEYNRALDLITDNLGAPSFTRLNCVSVKISVPTVAFKLITMKDDDALDDETRDVVESSARFLYGLIHARFIVTSRGLQKMLEKYRRGDFGRCPRVYCYQQPLLPVGLSDIPYQKAVKLYCPRCEDIYSPKSNRHGSIDGAYFGTTFPHMLFMVYPQMVPSKGQPVGAGGSVAEVNRGMIAINQGSVSVPGPGPSPTTIGTVSTAASASKAEWHEPRMFGFKMHEAARLARWRTVVRDNQISLLEAYERSNQQPQHL